MECPSQASRSEVDLDAEAALPGRPDIDGALCAASPGPGTAEAGRDRLDRVAAESGRERARPLSGRTPDARRGSEEDGRAPAPAPAPDPLDTADWARGAAGGRRGSADADAGMAGAAGDAAGLAAADPGRRSGFGPPVCEDGGRNVARPFLGLRSASLRLL